MKLSETQTTVLKLMGAGWQLGHSHGMNSRFWLQQGGSGRGGKSKDVNANTAVALIYRGLIVKDKEGFPITTYKLVPLE